MVARRVLVVFSTVFASEGLESSYQLDLNLDKVKSGKEGTSIEKNKNLIKLPVGQTVGRCLD